MKECEKRLSEEEGFEREGMFGFEKGSERLRKMMEFFGYVWVGSRYSTGRVVLPWCGSWSRGSPRAAKIWARRGVGSVCL